MKSFGRFFLHYSEYLLNTLQKVEKQIIEGSELLTEW